ncbi:MAG: hypothetical protein GY842_08525 [bacterium]|nr:hypothetical protein [bacterium]
MTAAQPAVSRTWLALATLCLVPLTLQAGDPQPPAPAATSQPSTQPVAPTTQPVDADGWTTTETGLKYKDLRRGDGPRPQQLDLLIVNYTGTLADGTVFDSTDVRGTPYRFRIGAQPSRVIAGWEESLLDMQAGGKRSLIIPPHLGYGLEGFPPSIPANAVLHYEIELLKIRPAPKMTQTRPEEVVSTPSGLRLVMMREGTGESPTDDSIVDINASVWRPDGLLMASTEERGDVATLLVSSIRQAAIREGIKAMKAGGKCKLLIPPLRPPTTQPADGEPPVGMIAEVELLKVSPRPPAPVMPTLPDDKYIQTPSGLKYHDLKIGEGETPKPSSHVRIHYTGWLADGTVFESSKVPGTPAEIPLDIAIDGWAEGILTMKVGGTRILICTPELGYGDGGRPGMVPPGATLIFEIELLRITRP